MFIPYELTITQSGYQFTTDSGLIYELYYSKYYLLGKEGEEIVVNSFSFFNNKGIIKSKDPRVKSTIVSHLIDFFNKNAENSIVYVCSQEGDLARHRRIIFGHWHKEMADIVEKHNCGEEWSKLGFYSSLLIRRDHVRKQEIIDAFYRHLDEFYKKTSRT